MREISLLSWNVNGIRAAAKKGFVEQVKELEPDIICLQEIKAKVEQLPPELLEIEGYRAYFNPAERPGYSGVAVYSRIEPDAVCLGIGDERYDREGRALILDFPSFRLLNAYFPNGGSSQERLDYKMDFCEEILQYAKAQDRPLLICGDVNTAHEEIDLARPKENVKNSGFMPHEREWIDRFLAAGFIDTFRLLHPEEVAYSWWDMKTRARERNIGWRIDYFFASQSLQDKISDAYILPDIMGSDHCPIGLKLIVP